MSKGQVKSSIIYGILGVLIVGGLGTYLLTPDQIDRASTCTTNNITGIFERLSKTNITAYWTVDGVERQSVCTKGKWIPTRDWLQINGLTDKDISIGPIDESIITEDGIEIITEGQTIMVDKAKQVSIEGKLYNISYTEKPPIIKCICDKKSGCMMSECLQ